MCNLFIQATILLFVLLFSATGVAATPSRLSCRTESSIETGFLAAHNVVRSAHGAGPLVWSSELAQKAQEWASGCQLKQSRGSLGPYGENLAAAAGPGGFSVESAVQVWIDDALDYDPSHPTYNHFTQVVWKSSTELGCAVASCDGIFDAGLGKATYYVCEYNPPGNVVGQAPLNVQV
ncbi:hypothetical protein JAAARDRAFT_166489 [Jaapia argillacea MUCL 33604]|uniref:SCP domain-containing protein n=1 Tax=Jaapia argillacea MUCL 33604 TaxID=933084 RepID=A0A067QDX5_9AGAM|nr:hypothetical protein JAAARDRAFT_166489 [Jaapia argillacea MUCL 33604]